MAVPKRKFRMIERAIQNQERTKREGMVKTNEERVSEEEHKKRIEKLKEMGLIK